MLTLLGEEGHICLGILWLCLAGHVMGKDPAYKASVLLPQRGYSLLTVGSQTTLCPQKLEEQDRRALSIKEQLQREHRFLKRRLEQLSVQSVERVRTDSTGSAVSTDDSEQGECPGRSRGSPTLASGYRNPQSSGGTRKCLGRE